MVKLMDYVMKCYIGSISSNEPVVIREWGTQECYLVGEGKFVEVLHEIFCFCVYYDKNVVPCSFYYYAERHASKCTIVYSQPEHLLIPTCSNNNFGDLKVVELST